VYGHLESVLDEVRAGIGRVEEEEDLDAATAAAAARLGVEPPASSPEDSPRFPASRATPPSSHEEDGHGDEDDEGDEEMLSATRPNAPQQPALTDAVDDGGDRSGNGSSELTPSAPAAEITQPSPGTGAEVTQPGPEAGAEIAQPGPGAGAEIAQPGPGAGADATQPVPVAGTGNDGAADGEGRSSDPDATQLLEPVGNKARSPKPATKDGKPRP
jgi:hypothetical protein